MENSNPKEDHYNEGPWEQLSSGTIKSNMYDGDLFITTYPRTDFISSLLQAQASAITSLHTQSLSHRRLAQSPIPQKGNIDRIQGKNQKEKEEHWEEQKIANEREEMNEE